MNGRPTISDHQGLTTKHRLLAEPASVYFANLDALRFFAFLGVFVAHSLMPFRFPQDSHLGKWMIFLASANGLSGVYGVRFFFVLSGFLITFLMFKEIERTGRLQIGKFYMRRILRIWPLYFLSVLIAFYVYPLIVNIDSMPQGGRLVSLVYNLLFLSNFDIIWHAHSHLPLPVWSLAVEEQFYFVWPILFLVLLFLPRKWFPISFVLLAAISLTFQLLHITEERVLYFHSISNMWWLVVGGILAYLAVFSPRFIVWIRKLSRASIALIYVLGAGSLYMHLKLGSPAVLMLHDCFLSFFFGFVILEQNYSSNSLFKFGRLKLASRLGAISYGLYMWHLMVIVVVEDWMGGVKLGQPGYYLFCFAAGMGLTIVLSLISYKLIERPFLKLKRSFSPLTARSMTQSHLP